MTLSTFLASSFNSSVSDLVVVSGVNDRRVGEVKTTVAAFPGQYFAKSLVFRCFYSQF